MSGFDGCQELDGQELVGDGARSAFSSGFLGTGKQIMAKVADLKR
ncbi:hypothetical protein [Streptomyces sp. NPDC094466]